MSTHKAIDRICVAAAVLSLLFTLIFMNGYAFGLQPAGRAAGYESRLFDSSRIHTVDIVMDDWDGFISTCQSKEYSVCSVVIDGESYKNVGIRGKGNTSLSSVAAMGSSRYSFKLSFGQYDGAGNYHGLDKLCLNNLIQDNTMMKDYLTYQMMDAFGVASPLCSFVYVTVNGEEWGLYLAVEDVEEAFLQRNYGSNYGQLYKPDSMGMGGGRAGENSGKMEEGAPKQPALATSPGTAPGREQQAFGTPPGGGFGSASDVKLQYIDNDPDSYANIFDNAKTDSSKTDQKRLIASLQSLSNQEDLEAVLDMEAVLRYFVVHNFVVNGDSYTGSIVHNYYLYEEDARLSMIPWDYNLAFGTFNGGAASSAVNDPIDDALDDRPMQAWIFSDEGYTRQYHALHADFLDTVDFEQMIEEAYSIIAPYVEKDPTKFCTYEEFETGVQALKTFCSLRRESIQGQLAGTVPATREGQDAHAEALIDAGSLNLSDMGMMDSGKPGQAGGRGDRNRPGEGTPASNTGPAPDRPNSPEPETEENTLPTGAAPTEPGAQPSPFASQDRNFSPAGRGQEEPGSSGPLQSAIPLLAVSALLLAAGLLAAFRYKR